eukprot:15069935-Ditylum_brightwellii.AAC.1
MQEVIIFMNLLDEFSTVFDLHMPKPEIYWKVFEDNKYCIAIAKVSNFSPRTKDIALNCHHFCKVVEYGKLIILCISTKEQTADVVTSLLMMRC